MLFASTSSERSIEFAMQQTPSFKPRGGGIFIMKRFAYTTKTCDCQYCSEYIHKSKQCRSEECLCFNERLTAGAVTYSELVQRTFKEINIRAFQLRLLNIIRESEKIKMFYRNIDHKKKFTNEIISIGSDASRLSSEFLSALFLLTSNNKLWKQVKSNVISAGINFENVDLHDIDINGYTLFKTAQDLYFGSMHITIADLTNPEIIEDYLMRLICNAFMIRRHGFNVLKLYRNEGELF